MLHKVQNLIVYSSCHLVIAKCSRPSTSIPDTTKLYFRLGFSQTIIAYQEYGRIFKALYNPVMDYPYIAHVENQAENNQITFPRPHSCLFKPQLVRF